jgi:hypothetical protein
MRLPDLSIMTVLAIHDALPLQYSCQFQRHQALLRMPVVSRSFSRRGCCLGGVWRWGLSVLSFYFAKVIVFLFPELGLVAGPDLT